MSPVDSEAGNFALHACKEDYGNNDTKLLNEIRLAYFIMCEMCLHSLNFLMLY